MYTLIIEDHHGRSAAEISFDQGSYTIGRVDGNDVVLSSNSVSRSHARIFVSNNKCYIDDLGSANGVFVDGVQIKERTEIRNGSKIRIGEYTLYLEYKDQSDMNPGQDVLKTQIVSSGQSGYKIVRVMDKFAGEEFMLSEASNSIGRTEDNYILLSDQSISRNHAKIVNKAMNFFVVDLDSSNGTFVNNKKITSECPLNPGDLVRFGNVNFVFVPVSQRIDLSQYARKKTNDNKTFILFFSVLIFILIGVIAFCSVFMAKRNAAENEKAQQSSEIAKSEALQKFNTLFERATAFYEENEFEDAKEVIESLQKEWGSDPKIIKLNQQINSEVVNNNYIHKGLELLNNKNYEDAISELTKVESDSKLHSSAKDYIEEAKRKMRLDEYTEARADCDNGFSSECIAKLCDATLALDKNSASELEKYNETVELMEKMSKNKKNKFAADAKKCYVDLKEQP